MTGPARLDDIAVAPLAGRRALVTGGSRGIGAGIVRRLAADGAAVAFTYREAKGAADSLEQEITGSGGQAWAIQADSAEPEAVRMAVAGAVERFDGLDVLVNNAGVSHVAPVEEFSLADFDRLVAVNVRAVFVAIQAALPYLGASGRIVSIGSVLADRAPIGGVSVYSLTKAGVAGLSRSLARELGPRGITVNTVQPGPVETDLNPDSGEFADAIRAMTAVGHYAQPRDIADAVAFLARAEAGFVTGASWNVDGGYAL
ncbi:3-oxoacyl-ACP reductase family protein [Streptomyces hyaluromycini]|uniref:3-oxoacyl-ACP reductase family protein n=1 Tax=Streptomyces hyaluromycini TaxID=1377993 RepID=UPI000B5D06A1|nr:3-oxoacyl-ACP reductase family protein [Streptomyces hyaluromycini]